jgi:hypothetical protein
MKTQRRPGLQAGMAPRFARPRTSSGCIFRKAAASASVSVFMRRLQSVHWMRTNHRWHLYDESVGVLTHRACDDFEPRIIAEARRACSPGYWGVQRSASSNPPTNGEPPAKP